MKKFVFSVYSDTAFVGAVTFALGVALFRFYLKSLAFALLFAALTAAATATLVYLHLRKKYEKKSLKLSDEKEVSKLSFHLALDSRENNAERLYAALFAKTENAKREDDLIRTDEEDIYFSFKLEPVRADEIAELVKKGGARAKVFYTNDVTAEAAKLADAFGIQIKRAADVYLLLKEANELPERYILAEKMKTGWKDKLKFRLRRSAYKGYLLAGVALLAFSLFTFFPVYYLVAGGILLCAAIAVRFFGVS